MRHMEYVFPHQGFADVKDQYMLGDQILVAPMVEKGKTTRTVLLPKGRWRSEKGKILKGPAKLELEVPLDQLPYFELVK